MGCVIYVDGSLEVCGEKLQEVKDKINSIKDGWGDEAFSPYLGQDGYIEFSCKTMEGNSPFTDGIETPLKELLEIAAENNLTVNGTLSVSSSWSDYDDMEINISDNEIIIKNSVLSNASTEELIEELIARNVLPKDFKAA